MKLMASSLAASLAALSGSTALTTSPPGYFGATRNLFLGPQVFFKNEDGGAGGDDDVAALAERVKKAFETQFDEVKGIATDALGKVKAGEQMTKETKEKADEALTKLNKLLGLKEQVDELAQKLAEGGAGDQVDRKSAGQMFVEDERVKAKLAAGMSNGDRIDLRIKTTLTSLTTDAGGSVGDAINQTRLPEILPLPQRRLYVRDLISPGQMDGNTLEYVKETGFTNGAAAVGEGAAKPESDIKLDLVTTSAKVIAHWMKASRQVLSDISQLRSMIDERLLYGLKYVEEQEILNGDNTGQHLNGIVTQATAYAAPIALADLNIIDVLRLAMLQASLAEYPATGHVLNPIDMASIETLKDGEGRYIIGNPQGTINKTLWGLPVVETQAMTVRKFLTGAFKLGAQLFDRWDARIEAGFVNDDFIKNLSTILGEERLALAVYRPEAFIYGDFDTALAA